MKTAAIQSDGSATKPMRLSFDLQSSPCKSKRITLCALRASSDRRRAEVALWRVTKAEAGGEILFFHNRRTASMQTGTNAYPYL